jgi:hypothetical protein
MRRIIYTEKRIFILPAIQSGIVSNFRPTIRLAVSMMLPIEFI